MVKLVEPVSRRALTNSRIQLLLASLACLMALTASSGTARGQANETKVAFRGAGESQLQQPNHILPRPALSRGKPPASEVWRARSGGPSRTSDHSDRAASRAARQANFQTPQEPAATSTPEAPAAPASKTPDPCAALQVRPFSEFGINVALPSGTAPENHASRCWDSINASAGPLAGARGWGATTFAWNATCLCHRPLYFEEINLERYGYGCGECLQPAASAAHFFATIPTLPYCMATDCPSECVYTLGHYRPGNCNPWQRHWHRWSTRAALAEGGVWTGMVFLIP